MDTLVRYAVGAADDRIADLAQAPIPTAELKVGWTG
jgi:hypothetical protein